MFSFLQGKLIIIVLCLDSLSHSPGMASGPCVWACATRGASARWRSRGRGRSGSTSPPRGSSCAPWGCSGPGRTCRTSCSAWACRRCAASGRGAYVREEGGNLTVKNVGYFPQKMQKKSQEQSQEQQGIWWAPLSSPSYRPFQVARKRQVGLQNPAIQDPGEAEHRNVFQHQHFVYKMWGLIWGRQ